MKKLLILTVAVLAVASQALALTRGQMLERTRLLTDDVSTVTAKQTNGDNILLDRIHSGEVDVARKTRCLLGTTYYTTATDLSTYTLSSPILMLWRVSYRIIGTTQTYKRLARSTLLGMDTDLEQWENVSSGLPSKFFQWGNILTISPKPSAAYAGPDRIRIDYVVSPSSMTSDSAEPFNGADYLEPYHELPVYYAVAHSHMDSGNQAEADYWFKRYYDLMTVMIQELNDKPDWSPQLHFWYYNDKP